VARLVLLEAVPDALQRAPGDQLVALTAEAVYELERRGIEHLVLADIVDEAALAATEDEYWREQLEWFDLLGAELAARMPETADWTLPLPYYFSYQLKSALDIVFIRGFEISALLRREPDAVVLWRVDAPDPPLDEDDLSFLRGPSVLSRLLPAFCERAGVAYEEHRVAAERSGAAVAPPRRDWKPGAVVARGLDVAMRLASSLRRSDRRTFLFLSTAYDLRDVLRRARRRGHRCLILEGDAVFDISGVRRREVGRVESRFTEGDELADELTSPASPLWRWPDSWHGVPVSELLASRLRRFVATIAPRLGADANALSRIYASLDVDVVLIPYLMSSRQGAAAAAARLSPRTQSVVIEHGDGVFDADEFDLSLLLCFDHVFSGDRELADYYERRRSASAYPLAQVSIGSYRRQRVARESRGRRGKPPVPVAGARPLAVYVVSAAGGDHRYLNSAWYSDAWYFQLQARIVEALARQTDYDVVVKTFPAHHVAGPLADYVADIGAAHMISSSVPFRRWLPFANRVVLDFPSTALYECALAGTTYLALVQDHLKVRPEAVASFGSSLQAFRSIEDAVDRVESFLRDPAWRSPAIEPPATDLVDELERLAAQPGRDASA
jgi:hypothetical protein